jgi:ELWxxDGT repeat protein
VFKNEVLFAGGDHGLWVTDGTAQGTHELTGIENAYPGALSPSNFAVFDGKVLFEGMDAQDHESLWVTNGTASGTHELVGIQNANPNGLDPQEMTVLNGEVLFRGVDANGQINLWITNGTARGTHELAGIANAYAGDGGMNAHSIADVGLDQSVALFSQYMASAFVTSGSGDGPTHAADPPATTEQQTFFTLPQHT